VDWLNQTWTMSCIEMPFCETLVDMANGTLQFECLEFCDADPTCFAATWNSGHCTLCQGALDGSVLDLPGLTGANLVYYPATPTPVPTSGPVESLSTSGLVHSRHYNDTHSASATATSAYDLQSTSSSLSLPTTFITVPTPNSVVSEVAEVGITGTETSLLLVKATTVTDYSASDMPSLSPMQIQGNTFETAAAPSSTKTMVSITGTVTQLSPFVSNADSATMTSTTSFVPPLTDGVVSLATPGGQTRAG
jgi:hypothetical protein